tara:strand:+ start:1734 stop:2564 length:831 start_codon:yes stop_codon:yes gene_type:complete
MTIKDKREKNNILTKSLISRQIPVECKYINSNITDTLLKILQNTIEGKCIDEGYIQKQSIKIVNYSSGLIKSNIIIFQVVFECFVYHLVEGVELSCIAKNITKAGIRAELEVEDNPVIIFVARDHHYINSSFNKVKEGDDILVKVIGQRYELNDINICVIAELIKINKSKKIEGAILSKTSTPSKENIILSKKSQPEDQSQQDVQKETPVESQQDVQKKTQVESQPNIGVKIEPKIDGTQQEDGTQQDDGSKKLVESSKIENATPVKRKPGRPRKK